MQLTEEKIKHILNKYREMFEILENYDKTRVWPIGRAKLNLTLDKKTISKLKKIREKTGEPISQIIDRLVEKI